MSEREGDFAGFSTWPGQIMHLEPEPPMPDCPLAYYEDIVAKEEISTQYIVNMALMLLSEDRP